MDVNLGEGLLEKDIKAVLSAKTTNPNKKSVWYSVVIHTVDIDLALPLLDAVLTYRDYNTSYGVETIVLVAVGMGDYIKDIYPHTDNLEMSLGRTDTKYVTTLRFKAVINSGTSIPKGEKYDKLTKEELNKSEIYNDLTYLFLENKETVKNIQVYNLKDLIDEQMEYYQLMSSKKKI